MRSATLVLGAAIAAAGMVGSGVATLWPAAALAADAAPKIGAAVGKPLKAAQEAMQTKSWDEALAQIDIARAIEPKTPYEQYMTNEMLWFVQLQKKQYAEAAVTLEQQLASGQTPAADVPLRTKTLTQLNYQVQNYPKAIEMGNRYLGMVPADREIGLLVAQSYALSKDYKGAADMVRKVSAVGGVPDEQLLRIGLRSNFELKDRAATLATLEQLVRNYPKKEYWKDLLTNTLFQTKEDRELRHLYRLMNDVGTLDEGDNCSEAGTVLVAGGYPTEAGRILDRCSAANLFQGDLKARAQATSDSARRGAEADRKDLATADKALAAAKTGNEFVATGKLYFSSGEHAKAVDALAKGLAKGGVTDAADATMLLGIAQARSGGTAAALTTFNGVTDVKLARIAQLWVMYLQPPPAAAPAAPAAPAPPATTGG